MKSLPIISIILSLTLLGSCQKNLDWRPLDGASANPAQLEKARKTCRLEAKLAGLERAQEERDKNLGAASTNQAKTLVKDDYEQVKRQVYLEIDTCMRKQGYKR